MVQFGSKLSPKQMRQLYDEYEKRISSMLPLKTDFQRMRVIAAIFDEHPDWGVQLTFGHNKDGEETVELTKRIENKS
jgi:hypothetical protein